MWLAATTVAAGADEPVDLVLWNLPIRPANTPLDQTALRTQVQYLDQFPEFRVRRGGGPQLQRFGRGTREFLMAQAGGIAPDVIDMSDVDVQDYISRNFLLPLNDYLKEAGMLEQMLNHPLAEQFQKDGVIYAVPVGPCKYPTYGAIGPFAARPYSYALLYRRDAFEEVGLDPDRPPETWDELVEYAERLFDPDQQRVGFVLPMLDSRGTIGAGGFVELVLALNGVEAIRQSDDGTWRADFADDPRAVEAVEFIRRLMSVRVTRGGKEHRGVVGTGAGFPRDSLLLFFGRTGMIIQTLEELAFGQLDPEVQGAGLMPLGPSGDGFVPLVGQFMGINALSQIEERRRAAFEWIRIHTRPEYFNVRAKAFIQWGWADYIDPRDVDGDPELRGYADTIPAQYAECYRRILDNARPLPISPRHRQLRQEYLSRPIWEFQENPDQDVATVLRQTQDAINTELFGVLPQEVKQRRSTIALTVVVIVAVAIFAAFLFNIRALGRSLAADRTRGTVFQAGRRRIYIMAALLILPAVGSVILWMYLPLVRGVLIAFLDYQLAGSSNWVGLQNFIDVLTDNLFWISLLRTMQYGAISLTLGFLAPIVLAFLLSEAPRGKILLRILFYLPALTSGLVIMFLWQWIYNPSAEGLLNTLIAKVGTLLGADWGPYGWLNSHRLAMISVVLPTIWAGMGPGCIIYLAALRAVPEELYEAADLDGAGPWSKIRHVAVPFIKPLIVINFLGAFIGTFHTMQNVFVMTGGGPGDATYVVGLYIFYNAFFWLQFGKATAAAWILGSLLIGFTIYQLRIMRDLKFQAGGTTEE